jgi:hypothetical protein
MGTRQSQHSACQEAEGTRRRQTYPRFGIITFSSSPRRSKPETKDYRILGGWLVIRAMMMEMPLESRRCCCAADGQRIAPGYPFLRTARQQRREEMGWTFVLKGKSKETPVLYEFVLFLFSFFFWFPWATLGEGGYVWMDGVNGTGTDGGTGGFLAWFITLRLGWAGGTAFAAFGRLFLAFVSSFLEPWLWVVWVGKYI